MVRSGARPRGRLAAAWTLQGLLAALFLFQGGAKLASAHFEVEAFAERYDYPLAFMYFIGALELVAVGLLLVPRFTLYGAAWITPLMLGAAHTHIFREEAPQNAALPATVLVLAAVLAWLRASDAWYLPAFVRRFFPTGQ